MSDSESVSEDSGAENARMVRETVYQVLQDDISDSVFAEPEEVDPVLSMPMSERLDFQQLIVAYRTMLAEKSELEHKNDLLNRNLLKHFRLKKVFRAYNPDNPQQIEDLMKKYHESLDRLDEMMASRSKLAMDCEKKLNDIEEAQRNIKEEMDNNVAVQQKEIKEVGLRLRSSQTGHFMPAKELDRLISRMDIVRDRVSEVRLTFIETVDKHTEIDQKAKSLEDLGNGLRMEDFEQLRAARQNLTDKIEDRNNELARLRLRCNADTQILAHVREKEFMLDNFITRQTSELERSTLEMNMARNDANMQKTKRDGLRKSFNQLSQSCGLLDKPDLLVDFDRVTDAIEERKKDIDAIQCAIEKTTQKTKIALDELRLLENASSSMTELHNPSKVHVPEKLPWIRHGVPIKRLQLNGGQDV